jgi:hypothetical protein
VWGKSKKSRPHEKITRPQTASLRVYVRLSGVLRVCIRKNCAANTTKKGNVFTSAKDHDR